jgi:hypothetical protein
MWEAEVGGSWSEAHPGKIQRLYLKNKLKAKVQRGMDQAVL